LLLEKDIAVHQLNLAEAHASSFTSQPGKAMPASKAIFDEYSCLPSFVQRECFAAVGLGFSLIAQ